MTDGPDQRHRLGYADPSARPDWPAERSFRIGLFAPRNIRQLRRIAIVLIILFGTLYGLGLVDWLMGKH